MQNLPKMHHWASTALVGVKEDLVGATQGIGVGLCMTHNKSSIILKQEIDRRSFSQNFRQKQRLSKIL